VSNRLLFGASVKVLLLLALGAQFAVGGRAQLVPSKLSLAKATELLMQRNPTVLAAQRNLDALRAQRTAAGLRPTPTLTASATQLALPRVFTHPGLIFGTGDNVAANSTYTVEVDQLIERGDKRALRIAQAEWNVRLAEAQLRDAVRQQLFQLRQSFFNAVLARENSRVARENLAHFDRMAQVLRAQYREGYAAGVDLRRIEIQRFELERDAVAAEQTYQQAVRDVFNLIGAGDAPSGADVRLIGGRAGGEAEADLNAIEGDLDIIPVLLWIDDLRRLALANRPDVQAARFNVEAARVGVQLAIASKARDVTVGGQYARTGSDNTFGVVLSVPLKVGARARTAIEQATALELQAEAQLRQAETQALTDVEKAFIAYRTSRDRLRAFTSDVLVAAEQVRRTEEAAYREGARGLIDFLDAQRAYNQLRVEYNQARYDLLMSLYQLEYATGARLLN